MGLLTDFRLSVKEKDLGVYGVHVYRRGAVAAEHRFRSDDRENLYSGSKTFTSIGVGIARDEGRFALADRVLDFFPEHKSVARPGNEEITLRHLLQMSSGHMAEDFDRYDSTDRAALFFGAPMRVKAGTGFYYENLCTYMLGRVIEKVTGENLRDYLKPRVFDKLGIVNPQWMTCPLGHTAASTGLYLTTEEFSRIGITLSQDGVYQDTRIVSAEYARLMHTDWVDSILWPDPESRCGYGYQVWKCTQPNTYRADGMYGQFSVVLEDYETVVTVTAHNERNSNDILRAIWKEIVPAL